MLLQLTWHSFPPRCTQHALLWYEPRWSSPNPVGLTTAPPGDRRLEEIRLYGDEPPLWRHQPRVFTLNLGRLYWSSSASRISSVISTLLLKRFGFWLAWFGLEFCPAACLSSLAGRDFLSLPNTTPSQSFNHLSKHRLVNYSRTENRQRQQRWSFLRHPLTAWTQTHEQNSRHHWEVRCSDGERICPPTAEKFELLCLQDPHSLYRLNSQAQQTRHSRC